MKRGKDEPFNIVQDYLEEIFPEQVLIKLKFLIENNFVIFKSVYRRVTKASSDAGCTRRRLGNTNTWP